MKKLPGREKRDRRTATSNKQKRERLQEKREARRKKESQRRTTRPRAVEYDVGFPPGAVAADLAQQAPSNSYAGAKLYYIDESFTCVTCGRAEVWTAAQQKWYYEVAKGSIYGRAIRCRACRQRIRRQRDPQRQRSMPPAT